MHLESRFLRGKNISPCILVKRSVLASLMPPLCEGAVLSPLGIVGTLFKKSSGYRIPDGP